MCTYVLYLKVALSPVMNCLCRALEEVTSARITITEVRVEVTDAGEVDISG